MYLKIISHIKHNKKMLAPGDTVDTKKIDMPDEQAKYLVACGSAAVMEEPKEQEKPKEKPAESAAVMEEPKEQEKPKEKPAESAAVMEEPKEQEKPKQKPAESAAKKDKPITETSKKKNNYPPEKGIL